MGQGAQSEPNFDISTPSVARMYDWLLGGTDNYASDREACGALLEIAPSSRELALTNRAFLRRVVRFLADDCGIRQFLDHGSGLPTRDNVHQVAQRIHADARVAYVDNDPIVLAHGRTMLAENDQTAVLCADLRDTDEILDHEDVRRLIRDDEPTAALFVSVLHCLPDKDDPAALLRRVADRLAPGSYMVVCQLVSDDARVREGVTDLMAGATGGRWGRVRSKAEVRTFLDGWELLDPGLVEVSTWRPDSDLTVWREGNEWEEWGGVVRL
ncbi:SAM-dependent methyltransferase [Streptomyces sporangiiformans]|uniref:SAM-dependent methyltransferase n=1 Tax=Streptomyces sporangiiformans TaxID=2315329 RepID=A0A505DQE8_9ACTN|nr:SAM-dependent methyltransferase [Streptomyces sporangiiformans]TPQ23504.1 SAM-dependent methyltransferase [Streptomyces sporangiiformans]